MDLYKRALDEYRRPFPTEVPMQREVFVAPTRAEAIRRAQPYLEEKYNAYRSWGRTRSCQRSTTSITPSMSS
jgi:hypothetical protein